MPARPSGAACVARRWRPSPPARIFVMPKADTSSITSRRALLATAALVAPATLLPAIAAAAEVAPDPHLAWRTEWLACLDHQNGPAGKAVDCLSELPEYHRALELEGLVGATPARTPAGVLAQLRIIAHWQGELSGLSDAERAGLANAIATLERLVGEASVPALPAVAAVPPESDAALLALGCRLAAADTRSDRRWQELEAEGGSGSPRDPVIRAAVDEIHACIGKVGRLPAHTPAGLAAKARIVSDEGTGG